MQGTAATAVAGVYGALAVQGKPFAELAQQRVVIVGAGSAGMGVARMLALGMQKQARTAFCVHLSSLQCFRLC
jgi:malic enzyme